MNEEQEPRTSRVELSIEQDKIPAQDLLASLSVWQARKTNAATEIAGALDEFAWACGSPPPPASYAKAHARLSELATNERLRGTARLLHECLWELNRSPYAAALCRILLGSRLTLEEEGDLVGCSRQAVCDAEKKLNRMFRIPRR